MFGKKGKVKLKGRALTTALTASCPGAGPDCSITAVATSGRKKAGSGKATVKANATAGLKIKLSKAGVKLLKRKHKLTLKLSGKRTGASTTSATRTVTLKARRSASRSATPGTVPPVAHASAADGRFRGTALRRFGWEA